MEIKPRLFYQVVKIQGRPRPLSTCIYHGSCFEKKENKIMEFITLVTGFKVLFFLSGAGPCVYITCTSSIKVNCSWYLDLEIHIMNERELSGTQVWRTFHFNYRTFYLTLGMKKVCILSCICLFRRKERKC